MHLVLVCKYIYLTGNIHVHTKTKIYLIKSGENIGIINRAEIMKARSCHLPVMVDDKISISNMNFYHTYSYTHVAGTDIGFVIKLISIYSLSVFSPHTKLP